MQKWEYLLVVFMEQRYIIKGEFVKTPYFPSVAWEVNHQNDVLNEMGMQGWELVAKDAESFCFKRPKSQLSN